MGWVAQLDDPCHTGISLLITFHRPDNKEIQGTYVLGWTKLSAPRIGHWLLKTCFKGIAHCVQSDYRQHDACWKLKDKRFKGIEKTTWVCDIVEKRRCTWKIFSLLNCCWTDPASKEIVSPGWCQLWTQDPSPTLSGCLFPGRVCREYSPKLKLIYWLRALINCKSSWK